MRFLLLSVLVACSTTYFTPSGFQDTATRGTTRVLPDFGEVRTQVKAPPPLAGGTLALLADDTTAIAADAFGDKLFVADVKAKTKVAEVQLQEGAEPGRVAVDAHDRVHVVLRGSGKLLTIIGRQWEKGEQRAVCDEPRGLTYEEKTDQVHVACAGGELVTFSAASGPALRTIHIDGDLRDVVVTDEALYVSRFRAAELLQIDSAGRIVKREQPPGFFSALGRSTYSPFGAFRLAGAGSGVLMLHERGVDGDLTGAASETSTITQAYYPVVATLQCSLVADSSVTLFEGGKRFSTSGIARAVLPIDLAYSPVKGRMAIVAPANSHAPREPTVFEMTTPQSEDPLAHCNEAETQTYTIGEPIAVAYDSKGELYIQTREPVAIEAAFKPVILRLSEETHADTGHMLFHSNTGSQVTCASCHLEGGEDGRTWQVSGKRVRTPSLRGGIGGTAPFHWNGELATMGALMDTIYTGRMGGVPLSEEQRIAAVQYIEKLPPLRGAHAGPEHGRVVFETAGCGGCHSGEATTNNATVDVGTGGAFQVPSLRGLVWRAPYLHDGRAATLRDIGHGAHVSDADLTDLIAHLESL